MSVPLLSTISRACVVCMCVMGAPVMLRETMTTWMARNFRAFVRSIPLLGQYVRSDEEIMLFHAIDLFADCCCVLPWRNLELGAPVKLRGSMTLWMARTFREFVRMIPLLGQYVTSDAHFELHAAAVLGDKVAITALRHPQVWAAAVALLEANARAQSGGVLNPLGLLRDCCG